MIYFSAFGYQPTHSFRYEKFFLYLFKYKMFIFEHFKKPSKMHFTSGIWQTPVGISKDLPILTLISKSSFKLPSKSGSPWVRQSQWYTVASEGEFPAVSHHVGSSGQPVAELPCNLQLLSCLSRLCGGAWSHSHFRSSCRSVRSDPICAP